MSRLDGRVAVVTGAAGGIGAAYARALAGEGASVVVADVRDGGEIVAEIEAAGARARYERTDVSDQGSVERMTARTVEAFGRIDVLVNNAAMFGGMQPGPFEDIAVGEWDALMAVNVRGPWLCARAALPHMRALGYGKIVNVASGMLFKGAPFMLHYVTSKGAILAMTRALSREVGPDGIRVNTLAPGLTMSEAILGNEGFLAARDANVATRAIPRDGWPEDLVGALVFLASADSDFVTGQCLVVDGGSVNH